MKTLVIIFVLFLANPVHAVWNENSEYQANKTRFQVYLKLLSQVEMINDGVDNKFVKITAKYIFNNCWENNQGPILKKNNDMSDFWNAVNIYYESAQTLFRINFSKIIDKSSMGYAADYTAKHFALEVVFAILDHYGSDEYKKHIARTSLDIQGKIIRNEDIYPIDLLNTEKTNAYFLGASLSDDEKYYKALMVWLRCYFLAIEQTAITENDVFCEKMEYVKYAVDSKI